MTEDGGRNTEYYRALVIGYPSSVVGHPSSVTGQFEVCP